MHAMEPPCRQNRCRVRRMDSWTNGRGLDGWMDGWMDGGTEGGMHGWMDGWMYVGSDTERSFGAVGFPASVFLGKAQQWGSALPCGGCACRLMLQVPPLLKKELLCKNGLASHGSCSHDRYASCVAYCYLPSPTKNHGRPKSMASGWKHWSTSKTCTMLLPAATAAGNR